MADDQTVDGWRYQQCDWGDVLRGTKEQLQAFGLGVGRAYPGEDGAPTRVLWVIDPRGFRTKIRRDCGDQFCAQITFPGLPERKTLADAEWISIGGGIKTRPSWHFDEFFGTGEALAAAGLARLDQMPGSPGMRKRIVTVFADGSVDESHPQAASARKGRAHEPGAKSIERRPSGKFAVRVYLPLEESEHRKAVDDVAGSDWRKRVALLRRPEPLRALWARKAVEVRAAAAIAKRDESFQMMLRKLLTAPDKGVD